MSHPVDIPVIPTVEETPRASPEAPKLRTANLPDIDDYTLPADESDAPSYAGNVGGDLSHLSGLETFNLNQALLDESIPQRPLISPLESMFALRAEYEGGSQLFVQQIDWLMKTGWIGVRRTRGDGDCFYRSLAFAYVERILLSEEPQLAVTSAISSLEASQPLLEAAGFQKLVYEDFYDTFVAVLHRVVTPGGSDGELLTSATLLEQFNDPEVSNSIVVYLRLLTSAQMRADPEAYTGFLIHPELGEPLPLRDFCENFVEAVGKEADHVQMAALARVLAVNIDVAYLDGRPHGNEPGKVDFVEFRNPGELIVDPIILLYRPGHYDVLDKRDSEPL